MDRINIYNSRKFLIVFITIMLILNVFVFTNCMASSPSQPIEPIGPNSCYLGIEYKYSTSSTDPEGDDIQYGWDLNGDGIIHDWTLFYSSGQVCSELFKFDDLGTYNVRVKARDRNGEESSWSQPLTVTISEGTPTYVPPIANAGVYYQAWVGEQLTVDGSWSYDPDGGIIESYRWDWDNDDVYDTSWSEYPTASHTFTTEGTYTIKLMVYDDDESHNTDTDEATVFVYGPPNQNPVADAGGPYNGYIDVNVTFDGSGSTDDSSIVLYEWDWDNDGVYDDTGITQSHSWEDIGAYTIVLRVTDDEGENDTDTTTVTVNFEPIPDNEPPIADAGGPYSGYNGSSITFDGSGSTDDSSIVLYEWDWDNDGVYDDTGITQSHSWEDIGAYTIVLRVTDDEGENDTNNTSVTIEDVPAEDPPDEPDDEPPIDEPSDDLPEEPEEDPSDETDTTLENEENNESDDENQTIKIIIIPEESTSSENNTIVTKAELTGKFYNQKVKLNEKILDDLPKDITESPIKDNTTEKVIVYLDLKITVNNTYLKDDDAEELKFYFKIPKTWLKEKNEYNKSIDKKTIILMRYHNGWQELETRYINENETYFYYEVNLSGCSTFAVVGSKVIQDKEEEQDQDVYSIPWITIIGFIGLMMTFLIIALFKYKYIYVSKKDNNEIKKIEKTKEPSLEKSSYYFEYNK